MIDSYALQIALRSHALDLVVATTSGVNLAAQSTTVTRASGSWLTDGFSKGMEVTLAGFTTSANNDTFLATNVTALDLTIEGTLTSEASASGRTVTAGLPTRRAWENVEFEIEQGYPWVEEQLVPGPTAQIGIGPNGTVLTRLLYALHVHALEDTGIGAPVRYADALCEHFAPRTEITFGSLTAKVRTDTGPYRGQMLRRKAGYVTVPVTFPLEVYSSNVI